MQEKWFDIGVDLRIDPEDLSKIRAKYRNESYACLIDMIRIWLKRYSATWMTLARVLGSSNINEVKLAKDGTYDLNTTHISCMIIIINSASLKDQFLGKEQNQDNTAEVEVHVCVQVCLIIIIIIIIIITECRIV